MGKIIAVCNQKGGVGKTTTAINLSTFLADKGKKILLVDMDPQANATSGLGRDKKSITQGTYEFLMGLSGYEEIKLEAQIPGLSLLPSNSSLAGAEVELVSLIAREFKLKEKLAEIKNDFDFIFIDCPPSLGLLTVNALVAAEGVMIPLQCEYYALEGLSQLMETIGLVRRSLNPQLDVEGVVLTMADFRTRLTDEVIKEVRGYFKERVFNSIIPRSIRLSEAPGFGEPILIYDRASTGAQKYEQLAEEFIGRHLHSGGNVSEPEKETYNGKDLPESPAEPQTETETDQNLSAQNIE